MRHYCAVQMTAGPNAGKWMYCCGGHPVGYCCPWEVCPECLKTPGKSWSTPVEGDCPVCNGTRRVDRPTPCEGHATAEEACEHQRQYLLDHATYQPETPEARARASQLNKCEAVLEGDPRDRYDDAKRHAVKRCSEFTYGYASHGPFSHTILCAAHCTREFFAPLVSVGESWQS